MTNLTAQLELFRDLINGQIEHSSENTFLKKNLALYHKKLNCMKVCVLKSSSNKYAVKQIIPKTLSNSTDWNYIQKESIQLITKKTENFYEIQLNNHFYYSYPLKGYGILILERKNPFDKRFNNTFVTIVQLFGKNLSVITKKRFENTKQIKTFKDIISNMNLGLLELNLNDEITYCNQKFLETTSYTLDEIKNKNILKLLIYKENIKFITENRTKTTTKIFNNYKLPIKNKQGEKKWVIISSSPNFNYKGEFIGSVHIVLDITKHKKEELLLEKALLNAQAASKAKQLFLANMSHEIRTPLNGIIGIIKLLNKKETSLDKNYLNSALKASQHLSSVVNNVLDMTKIESGELHLIEEDFEIKEVINNVCTILKDQAIEKNIELNVIIDPTLPNVFNGDSSRIRQILINLVGNAIKFTNEGEVILHCHADKFQKSQCKLNFIITDTGIGMTKEYLTNPFEKFQQEDNSISKRFGGSGLGLSISKQLTNLMGGDIQIKSKKHTGTEIQVGIPITIGKQKNIKPKTKNIDYHRLHDAKILLVEDDEINRLVVNNSLIPLNVKLTEVENGLEATRILKKETFDLILMDIQMPVMDGLEATMIIRNILKIKTPIIALSANAFKSEIEQCISTGMDDYLTKPFEEDELLQLTCKYCKVKKNIDSKKKSKKIEKKQITKSYDLDKLKKMSRDNPDFVKKMLLLFIDTIPRYLKEINDAYSKGDIETIKKTAHKMKPSIHNMGITSLKKELNNLECFSPESDSNEYLQLLIDKITKVLSEVVSQLRKK